MKRLLAVGLALVVGVLLVGLAAKDASAQRPGVDPVPVTPEFCEDGEMYDLDGNGKVNANDAAFWLHNSNISGLYELDGLVGTCPPDMDVNGDGFITHDDLNEVHGFLVQCAFDARSRSDAPGRP
jgi:hypothetical protein